MSDVPLKNRDFIQQVKQDPESGIRSVVKSMMFADFGIVQAVKGSATAGYTVDVLHAVPFTDWKNHCTDVQTDGVEVVFPTMNGLSISGTVAKGDLVLMIGTRGLLVTTQGVTKPIPPPENWIYSQQNLKAIPLSGALNGLVQFGEENGKAFLRTDTYSLITGLVNIITGVLGLTITSPPGTSGGPCTIVDTTGDLASAKTELQGLITP